MHCGQVWGVWDHRNHSQVPVPLDSHTASSSHTPMTHSQSLVLSSATMNMLLYCKLALACDYVRTHNTRAVFTARCSLEADVTCAGRSAADASLTRLWPMKAFVNTYVQFFSPLLSLTVFELSTRSMCYQAEELFMLYFSSFLQRKQNEVIIGDGRL